MTSADVVVIGAGFAGLSAATALAARGARVVVCEQHRRLGGRATAFVDRESGERVDNGQHLLAGCYHHTFEFLRRIGQQDAVALQDSLDVTFVDPAGRPSRLRTARLPPPWHLAVGLARWSAVSWRDRLGAARLARDVRGNGAARSLDDITVDEWLRRRGQTARLRTMLWDPLAVAALNQDPAEAAAAPFLTVLQQMFGGSARNGALGLPRQPLDELYAEPSRRFLEAHGGKVLTGTPARVVVRGERVEAVTAGDGEISTPLVISAVAWYDLARLFATPLPAVEPLLDAAARTEASPIVTATLWFDRPLGNAPFIGLPGRRWHWIFDKAALLEQPAQHLSVVASGARELVGESHSRLVDEAVADVRAAVPEARGATLRRAVVVRERRATFSVAPGQPPRPPTMTPVRGLLLAGDWIATGLPATIESAVVSGHRAADAALAS